MTEAEKELGTLVRVEPLPDGSAVEWYVGSTVTDLTSWFRRYERELRRIERAKRTRWHAVERAWRIAFWIVVGWFVWAAVLGLLSSSA